MGVFGTWLRVYPPGFGQRLLEVFNTAGQKEVRRDLRKCYAVDPGKTDRENFLAYPDGDSWGDAELISVCKYIANYKGLAVPNSWEPTMKEYFTNIFS